MSRDFLREPNIKRSQFDEVSSIGKQLRGSLSYSNFRNYQKGSVYVERDRNIVGLCFDGEDPDTLYDLEINANKFPHLRDLVIRSSKLQQLPDWVWTFQQVDNIILVSLDLEEISGIANSFPQLKFLALPGNNLSEIPDLSTLEMLLRLNLSDNKLEHIPGNVEKLENLISLSLDNNFLQSLPNKFATNRLYAVNLNNNQFSEFPRLLRHHPSVKHLNLSTNFIDKLPNWIGSLENLEHLDLSNNRIRDVPNTLSDLQNLKRLYLTNNSISSFPNSIIPEMDSLQVINIKHGLEDPEIGKKLLLLKKLSDMNFNLVL